MRKVYPRDLLELTIMPNGCGEEGSKSDWIFPPSTVFFNQGHKMPLISDPDSYINCNVDVLIKLELAMVLSTKQIAFNISAHSPHLTSLITPNLISKQQQ